MEQKKPGPYTPYTNPTSCMLPAWPKGPAIEKRGLLCEAAVHQLDQTLNRSLLIRAVRNDANGGAAHDAQRQHTQQALGVYPPLFFFDPDGRLVLIGLLNEESGGTSMQSDLVFNSNFLSKHVPTLLIFKK